MSLPTEVERGVSKLGKQFNPSVWNHDNGRCSTTITFEGRQIPVEFRVEPGIVLPTGRLYIDGKLVESGHERLTQNLTNCFYWTA